MEHNLKSFFWDIDLNDFDKLKNNESLEDSESFYYKNFLDFFPIADISNSGGIFLGSGVTSLGIGIILEARLSKLDRINLNKSIEEWLKNYKKGFHFKAFDGTISPVTLSVYDKNTKDNKTIFSFVINLDDFSAEKAHASIDNISKNKTGNKNSFKDFIVNKIRDVKKEKDKSIEVLEELATIISKEVDNFTEICRNNEINLKKINNKVDVLSIINNFWIKNSNIDITDNEDLDVKNIIKSTNNILCMSSSYLSLEKSENKDQSDLYYSSIFRPTFENGQTLEQLLKNINKELPYSEERASTRIIIIRPYNKIDYLDKKEISNAYISMVNLEKIKVSNETHPDFEKNFGNYNEKKFIRELEYKLKEDLFKFYETCLWDTMREEWQEAVFHIIPGTLFVSKDEFKNSIFTSLIL